MCRTALPEHLNDPEEIENAFPDDSDNGRLFRWIKKKTKTWFVYGPRDIHKRHRFREWPKLLIAVGSSGLWRFEDDKTDHYDTSSSPYANEYLSRVQYNKAWHIQLQWPLFFLVQIGGWEAYIGFKRDADKVYWLAAYAGRTWK